MRARAIYKWLAFSGAAFFIVGIVLLFTVGQAITWVGHTDLEVRFVVTDANSGQPIPNATVHVRAEPGGFCENSDPKEFELTTDENGHATHLCKNCMCFGSNSLFEDTFAVHLPWWWFRVMADGYAGTDPEYLDMPQNLRQSSAPRVFCNDCGSRPVAKECCLTSI